MDTSLHYTLYTNQIIKQTFCDFKLIYANRHDLVKRSKGLIRESMVLSHFNYSIQMYAQLIQKNTVRLICGLRNKDHISNAMKELDWLTNNQRVIF